VVSFRADRHWHARFRTAPCSLDHSSCSSLRVARRSMKMRHAVRWRRQRRQGRCCRRWSCRLRARIPDYGRRGGQPVAPVLILRPRGSNCLHRNRNSPRQSAGALLLSGSYDQCRRGRCGRRSRLPYLRSLIGIHY